MPEVNHGLRNCVAGQTAIATVKQQGVGLSYRGYGIDDLCQHACFEEVAFLLIYGHAPNSVELSDYLIQLRSYRHLPGALLHCLELIPSTAHPMDVLRTGCSMLGSLEPETDFSQQSDIANRLLVAFPAMLCYWYHFVTNGERIELDNDADTISAYFLQLLHGRAADAKQQQCMNTSLILYAEHEFNASTFCARVCAATLTDFYSAITAAIGTLRGPLHGGANEEALELILSFQTPELAVQGVLDLLQQKKKIMGFGHAIYTERDPRNTIIKSWAEQLSHMAGDGYLYPIAEAIEKVMWNEKKLFPNLDFYSALAYRFSGIAAPLYTPIFVCARVSGWSAHIMEQREHNKLIRPSSEYIGPKGRPWKANHK